MTLSADILNQRSPYKLSQLGEFTFRFVTDQDIHYTVGFYKDTIFMDDGAYHYDHAFNVYRIYYGLYHPKTAQALLKKIEYDAFGDYVDEGLDVDEVFRVAYGENSPEMKQLRLHLSENLPDE